MRTFAFVLTLGFGAMGLIHSSVSHLEQATLRQCRDQAWPAEKHLAMSQFCRDFKISMERFGHY